MRVSKTLLTFTSALVLAAAAFLGAPAIPAAAATPGFHAAYFSESAFLSLKVGETGQFSVGFSNTGDQAWVKGTAGSAISLHTAAPLDNVRDTEWSSGWPAPNIYARQLSDLVAPAQIGFFVYNVKVPQSAPLGPHTFYGRPVVDGVGPLEDYGYYQIATVVASQYTLAITGTSPASPSTTSNPTVSGTGAPPSTTVSILDGTVTVGSGTSTADGAFSIALSSALAVGAHSLTASATGATASAVYTYTVTSSTTTTTTTTAVSGTVTLSRPGNGLILLTFNKAVNAGPATTAANFKWDSAAFGNTPTLQSGALVVRLDFPAAAQPAAGTHTLDVLNQTFQDGTTIFSPNPTSFTVSVTSDSVAPFLNGATAAAANVVDLVYSEPMRTTAYFPATNAIDSTARYTLQNPDGSAATTTGTTGSGALLTVTGVTTGGTSSDAALFNETKARITFSGNLATNVTYTLVASSFADQTGNTVTTASTTVAYYGTSLLPTVSSVTATQLTFVVTYSKAMAHAGDSSSLTAVTCAGTGTQMDNRSNYTLGGLMGTAMADAATKCLISSDERTVTFTFPNSRGYPSSVTTGTNYTYSIAGVSDNITNTNLITPNPTASTVYVTSSAPVLASAAYISATSFSVTFDETVSTSGIADTGSATNPANYSVTGGTGGIGVGTYGDLCRTGGTPSVSTSDSKTFTIVCTGANGKWGTSGTTLGVRNVIDSDSSTGLGGVIPYYQAISF